MDDDDDVDPELVPLLVLELVVVEADANALAWKAAKVLVDDSLL